MARSILRTDALFALCASSPFAARDFRDCRDCPTMVPISGGTFIMGTDTADPLHDALEGPTRSVVVYRFAAGRLRRATREKKARSV